jgi:hypothetical protein
VVNVFLLTSHDHKTANVPPCLILTLTLTIVHLPHALPPNLSASPLAPTTTLIFKPPPLFSLTSQQSLSSHPRPIQQYTASPGPRATQRTLAIVSSSMSASGVIDPRRKPAAEAVANDYRFAPPTLPRAICWTSLTHPDIFKEYISAEHLGE